MIGSGPGGASVAQRLAPTGKRILILERGDYLKREPENWSTTAVFGKNRYRAEETWHDGDNAPFNPALHYYVGGNSKLYGAALVRLRREDFGGLRHSTGISPAWPLGYDVFDPYYLEAEGLFHVHGRRGEDPTEPNARDPFPFPAVEHEPRIADLHQALARQGLRPFHLPLGILLDQKPGTGTPTHDSPCIRCAAFDGFPCLTNGKADSQIVCIDPTLKQHENVTLLTGAYVTTLETDPTGRTVTAVNVERDGVRERYSADIVVVACGALNSALLMFRSANGSHPTGLANSSDQVGRNYMRHVQSVLLAISKQRNDTIFQKTLALTDFYFGTKDWPFPMGFVQMCGKVHGEQVRGETLPRWLGIIPNVPFDVLANHALDFWLSSEDLPDPDNRITLDREGLVRLRLADTNAIAHDKLRARLEAAIDATNTTGARTDRSFYVGKRIGIEGVSHQAGTMRFGTDPTHVGAGYELQGARSRQSLCRGLELFSLGRGREPDPDDRRQRAAHRRHHQGAARLTSAAGREAGIERHAAVDEHRRAGHVIGMVRAEPDRGLGDVVRLPDPLVGHESHEIAIGLRRVPGRRVDRRADRARTDPVDADAMRCELLGHGLHEKFDAALRGRIVHVPGPGYDLMDGTHADHLPAAHDTAASTPRRTNSRAAARWQRN